MQTILYGNGVNRLTKGMPSWDQLIKDISDADLDEHIPNPLKYEALLMKKPYRGPDMRVVTSDGHMVYTSDGRKVYVQGELTEKILKENIANRLKLFGSNKVYETISKMPFAHFITTNYDNSLFNNIGKGAIDSRFREERVYSIRRNYVINMPDGSKKHYWPMHGNIESPASIMLGFDHYCGSLAKIEQFVKGSYDLNGERMESITKRLTDGIKDIISWVDLFFVSDIHIIGLNLGYEETDLWWVLNKRRRIKQADASFNTNRIIYYPVETVKEDIEQLFNSFDVEVVHLDKVRLSRPFMERYNEQLSIMNKNMHNN